MLNADGTHNVRLLDADELSSAAASAAAASPTFVNALPVTLLRAAAPSATVAATTAAATTVAAAAAATPAPPLLPSSSAPAPAAATATATAATATTAATPARCRSCGTEFLSKGKLFKHLRSGGACSVAAGLAPPAVLAPPAQAPPPATTTSLPAAAAAAAVAVAASASATTTLHGSHSSSVIATATLHEPGLAAAQAGDTAALRELLRRGWDVRRAVDRHGSGALHWAAGSGQLGALQLLLGHLAAEKAAAAVPPAAAGGGGAASAATVATIATVAAPLSSEAAVAVTRGRRDGKTPLHWAARNGQEHVVRYLLSDAVGVAPDAPTRDGSTPLHLSLFGGHAATAALLARAGAAVGRRNGFCCGATHWVAMGGSVAAAEWVWSALLLQAAAATDGRTDGSGARRDGDGEEGGKGGCDSESGAESGDSSGGGSRAPLRRFCEAQKEGQTPLHKAAGFGHAALCEWLVGRVGGGDAEGRAAGGSAAAAAALLGARDRGGYTAAEVAGVKGHDALRAWLERASGG